MQLPFNYRQTINQVLWGGYSAQIVWPAFFGEQVESKLSHFFAFGPNVGHWQFASIWNCYDFLGDWCPGAESNHRHEDFQSSNQEFFRDFSRACVRQSWTHLYGKSVILEEVNPNACVSDCYSRCLKTSNKISLKRRDFVIPMKSQSNPTSDFRQKTELPRVANNEVHHAV